MQTYMSATLHYYVNNIFHIPHNIVNIHSLALCRLSLCQISLSTLHALFRRIVKEEDTAIRCLLSTHAFRYDSAEGTTITTAERNMETWQMPIWPAYGGPSGWQTTRTIGTQCRTHMCKYIYICICMRVKLFECIAQKQDGSKVQARDKGGKAEQNKGNDNADTKWCFYKYTHTHRERNTAAVVRTALLIRGEFDAAFEQRKRKYVHTCI